MLKYLLHVSKQKEVLQVIKFGLVGAVCAVFDMLLFVVLYEYAQINYLVANLGSTCLAILLNYYISKKWVFTTGKYSSRVEFIAFMAFSLAGLFLNQVLVWLFVEHIHLDPKTGKLLSIILVAVFNFITKKLFVFKS